MPDPLMTLRFSLPWPPSVNTYWTHAVLGGKFKKARATVFLSEAGKRYRSQAILTCREQRVPTNAVRGRLAVSIVARPPDARTRDLDNLLKGSLDALKAASVIADDGDIDTLHVERGLPIREGRLELTITELGVFNEQAGLALEQPMGPGPQSTGAPF